MTLLGFGLGRGDAVSPGAEFNRGKFKELVLLLSRESLARGDEGFGMVKLNKLLYRADFEAFRLLGRPLTGETYEKQEYGPVARDLPIVLDELASEQRLYWQQIPRGPYTRKVPAASEAEVAQPDISQFSAEELRIIERALGELGEYGGKDASEWSHEQSAGWNVAREFGDAIPYGTALISTEPIPAEDLERAKQFVRDQGWIKEAS
jgi:uncharacterized phage-associated protein